jgi:hypothetical protein
LPRAHGTPSSPSDTWPVLSRSIVRQRQFARVVAVHPSTGVAILATAKGFAVVSPICSDRVDEGELITADLTSEISLLELSNGRGVVPVRVDVRPSVPTLASPLNQLA